MTSETQQYESKHPPCLFIPLSRLSLTWTHPESISWRTCTRFFIRLTSDGVESAHWPFWMGFMKRFRNSRREPRRFCFTKLTMQWSAAHAHTATHARLLSHELLKMVWKKKIDEDKWSKVVTLCEVVLKWCSGQYDSPACADRAHSFTDGRCIVFQDMAFIAHYNVGP